MEDTSQRWRRPARPRARLHQHALILQNVRDSVIVTDLAGTITYWNAGATALFGYSAAEMLGRTPAVLYPSRDAADLAADLAAVAAGHDYIGEWQARHKDGTLLWIDIKTTVLRDAASAAVGYIGVSKDITARVQAEAALRASEVRLRRALEIETVGVIFFQTTGAITYANAAFLRMSGYTPDDLAQGLLRWDVLTPPADRPESLHDVEELATTGRITPHEKEYLRKDGSRWWALYSATRIDDETGVEYIIDMTASKRAAAELDQARAARDQFLATASHELQTPLTAIRAGLELLEIGVGPTLGPQEHELLAAARRNAERLRWLIADLLAAQRDEAPSVEAPAIVDLRAVVAAAVAAVQPVLRQKEQPLTLEVPAEGALSVRGDAGLLEQAILNLLANATRHTPPGTHIAVAGWVAAAEVHLTVRDSGPGIAPDALEAIFTRFHRGGRASDGLGLGLTIARGTVQRHGGRLWAESAPGAGATFHLVLPRAGADLDGAGDMPTAHDARAIAGADRNGERVRGRASPRTRRRAGSGGGGP